MSRHHKLSASTKVISNPPNEFPFKTYDLPPELLKLVSKEDIVENIHVNYFEVITTWLKQSAPTVYDKQKCRDMLGGKTDFETKQELYLGAKLACTAYAMPYFMSAVSNHLHFRNDNFWKYLGTLVAESTFLGYENMDGILEDKIQNIPLPKDAQVAGFYIRTPIKVWNTRNHRVYEIPKWGHRQELLKYKVIGNVNVYVLRQNFKDHYECYILFRGTCSEFNAIPQYGEGMKNTQLYNIPHFDPITGKDYKEGSETEPLFFSVYSQMVLDVMPHIFQALQWLKAYEPKCSRVVAAGHSMGGALVQQFCYLLKIKDAKLWDKTFFRSYAAPMTANHAAVLRMEQWIIDSKQNDKYLEVINRDDFINIQYKMGGKDAIKEAVREGSKSTAAWLLQTYMENGGKQQKSPEKMEMFQLFQQFPELAFSAFIYGSLRSQMNHIPEDKRLAFRLGQRPEECKLWKTGTLNHVYKNTLKLYYCERNIDWKTEYFGKSHSDYMDMNMSILWSVLRSYEDALYKYYAKNGLQSNNNLQIVPLFPNADMPDAQKLVDEYKDDLKRIRRNIL